MRRMTDREGIWKSRKGRKGGREREREREKVFAAANDAAVQVRAGCGML